MMVTYSNKTHSLKHSTISSTYSSLNNSYLSTQIMDRYQTTTVSGHNVLNNRMTSIQLRRQRFWSYTRCFTRPSTVALFPHCQQTYNPVSYLPNFPAHPMYRRRLKSHLFPGDFKLSDHHLVALVAVPNKH